MRKKIKFVRMEQMRKTKLRMLIIIRKYAVMAVREASPNLWL
jgi:hypothetical protein